MSTIEVNTTKCPICGGLIKRFGYGERKCTCCNEIFEVNYKDLDTLNRANQLRKDNAFTEAGEMYKKILQEDPDFIEANWGALLCHFGVEYVLDNGHEIPTIHRPISNYRIDENDYAKSIEKNTFGDDQDFYLDKIAELEELRSQIEVSCSNTQFDVFISCKITEDGNDEHKTKEYKWAQKIYEKLTNIGLKVFFSPESLPATNGAYEPKIYSALQSAKLLLILASTKEHLNSKWIKNEWGRYIELIKLNPTNKTYKLIIDTKSIAASDVPEEIRANSYINHNDQKWENSLLSAVKDCFKNIDEYRNFDFDVDTIDLSLIKKPKDKKLGGGEITLKYLEDENVIENPYEVEYVELSKDLGVDSSTARCCQIVESRLSNGNFKEANRELQKYLSAKGDDNDKLNYQILKLKIMVVSQSRNIEDFFETKISEYKDFVLFKAMINKLPESDINTMIVPISKYIVESIKSGKDNNAIDFYKSIVDINSDLVKDLNLRVMKLSKCLLKNTVLLLKYLDVCRPYVSSINLRVYIELLNAIARDLCENSSFDEAQLLVNNIYEADPQNSSALLTEVMIRNNANNQDKLIENIEVNDDFIAIEELIRRLNKEVVLGFVERIKTRIDILIDHQEFNKAYGWLNIISKLDFDNRVEYFMSIVVKTYDYPQSNKLFNVAINNIDEENKKFYVDYQLKFIKRLIKSKNFEQAKKNCENLRIYASTNTQVLRYEIFADTESSELSFKNIYKLKRLSLIEQMLIIQESQYKRERILEELFNNCVLYFENTNDYDDNIFTVFNKLITYSEKDDRLTDLIVRFGYLCLEKGCFEKAEWYFKKVVIINGGNDEAFWGIILAKLQCKNNDEVVKANIKINSFPEYEKITNYLLGDTETYKKYDEIVIAQEQYFNKGIKNNKGKKILIASISSLVIVIIAVIVAIVLLV